MHRLIPPFPGAPFGDSFDTRPFHPPANGRADIPVPDFSYVRGSLPAGYTSREPPGYAVCRGSTSVKASGTGIYQEVFDNIDYGDQTPEEAVETLLDGMESVGYTIG